MVEALQHTFMQHAMIAGALAAIACGIIGTYVVTKKMVFISGGISHASYGGVGIGYYLGISPIVGAMFFALFSAIMMGLVTRRTKIPDDTAIGILWAVGMAVGIIFIQLKEVYSGDLMSYLFGSILFVELSDLITIAVIDIVIILVVLLLYKEFLAISFDEEFSKVVGIRTEFLSLILLGLIAFTIVVLIKVVGIILIIALLTIPATIAKLFTNRLKNMMFLSVVFGLVITIGGLLLASELDLRSGATIVLVGAVAYGVSYLIAKLRYGSRGSLAV